MLQWTEASYGVDNPQRIFASCNVKIPDVNNWVRTPFIDRSEAISVSIEIRFTMRRCVGGREACVCVCVRERERERCVGRKRVCACVKERERESVCVCVCVCVRKRERCECVCEREGECV